MGGLAFAEMLTPFGEPPQVLRMSPELYQKLSAQFQVKLESIFEKVVIPRDAPAKKDYGDIDFLVRGIKPAVSSADEVWNLINEIIGAELHLNRGGAHSFGIPHPEITDAFVQVDVELSPGDGTPDAPELFEWTYFMKSDSDLVQIIGISHRPLGLTCNDEGLHIRVEQIEPYNKKKALLFLTRDPDVAMQFCGLDATHYRKGFTDEKAIFDWATSGRFFSPNIFATRVEKSNDRSRQAKRPMYRRFVEEYMPAHMEARSREWTRNEVLQEALDTFGKHTEYEAMMEEHRTKEAEAQLWDDIRAVITAGSHSKSIALKGLRRWVNFDKGEPRIATEAILEGQPPWTTRISPEGREDVLVWVRTHWEEVKELEAARAAAARASGTNINSEL